MEAFSSLPPSPFFPSALCQSWKPSAFENFKYQNHTPGVGYMQTNVQPGAFIQPSGVRKALLVGCNYRGTSAELRGCINDVHAIRDLLRSQGFPVNNMTILHDEDRNMMPTRANILRAMQWLVAGAKQGDVLFFHFSGHGSQQRDDSGMEADGYNETICPCDYSRAGQIIDDEIWSNLVHPLPSGVRLTAIMDCCHSGTGLDLPFTYDMRVRLESLRFWGGFFGAWFWTVLGLVSACDMMVIKPLCANPEYQ